MTQKTLEEALKTIEDMCDEWIDGNDRRCYREEYFQVLRSLLENKQKLEQVVADAKKLPRYTDYGDGYLEGLKDALELLNEEKTSPTKKASDWEDN